MEPFGELSKCCRPFLEVSGRLKRWRRAARPLKGVFLVSFFAGAEADAAYRVVDDMINIKLSNLTHVRKDGDKEIKVLDNVSLELQQGALLEQAIKST